jgi:hypothetical protein
MADDPKLQRAAEIDKAIKDADAKRRADEEHQGEQLDKLLSRLDGVMDGVERMSRRLDALEARDDDVRKRRARSADDHYDDRHKDDTDHEPVAEQPTEGDDDPIKQQVQTPGMARPVVADRQTRADAERERQHQCYDIQARLSRAAEAWGEVMPAAMTGELPEDYRVRGLSRFQRFSPDWKDVPLRNIRDPKILDAAEHRIVNDAVASSNSPDVSPGRLRAKTVIKGGHEITTFFGSPSVWLDEAAGNRMRRYVTRINPKATTE